jgi:hypothetical protein
MRRMNMWRSWRAAVVVSFLISGVKVAHAEETETAPTPAAPAPTDIVRLKNGGLLRGSIAELIPGESVTIVTAVGNARTFPLAEVDYAGPISNDPQANPPVAPSEPSQSSPVAAPGPKPYVTINAAQARLHLTSEPTGLTFHRQVVSASSRYGTAVQGYERLCTAPCDISLPAGTEVLALSTGNEPPVAAEPATFRDGASELTGTLESNAGIRGGGIAVMILGSVIALGMEVGAMADAADGTELNWPLLVGGLVVFAGGMGAGAAMMTTRDNASVQVRSSSPSFSLPTSAGFSVRGQL